MKEHRTDDGSHGIEHTVGGEAKRDSAPNALMKHHAESDERDADADRIKHHRFDIELQCLLRTCADTCHTDADKFDKFARCHIVEHLETSDEFQYEPRNTVVCRDGQIHNQLHNQEKIDAAPEDVVHLLLFPCLFYSHDLIV